MTDESDLAASEGTYDTFLREVARVTHGRPMTTTAQLQPGSRLLGGRFEIERAIGSGGMGVVYAARDHHRGCTVAVKTLRVATLDALHRLRDEFLVLHDLAHPNLVSLGELFDDDGRWFFSMELVDGVDFLSHVRPDGVLDLARLRRAMAQLAAGLGCLHAAGKVHRDVKPSNVLCAVDRRSPSAGGGDPDGSAGGAGVLPRGIDRVVLLDFGLASGGGEGNRAGTLPYMAPEQYERAHVGPPADWYSVGVMLWTALAGRLPFSGDDRELAASKLGGPPPVDGPADLAELAMALLDADPSRRPSDDEILLALGTPVATQGPSVPFVGRSRELAALRAAWDAAGNRTATALVRGPSGVGKSALIAQFAEQLRGDGAIVLTGRCHERVAMPYKAAYGIASALGAYLRDDPGARAVAVESRDVGLLPEVFPSLIEIEELVGAARAAPMIRDPRQRRMRVFDAFAGLIARLVAHAPVALMIDDLQWADRDGLALLEHVAAAAPSRVLVVAAARDGEIDAAATWLTAGTCIDVAGLGPDDAAELARRLAGDATAAEIAREATGHPLHIAELARYWQQRSGAAPPRLDEAIARRVEELPADHARVLALIVIAGALPQAAIGDAAALDGTTWWSAVAALRVSSLVRTHGPRGTDVVEPYHDRVRETVATRLPRELIVDGHTRLAAALESRGFGVERPDLLAYHFEEAERPIEAARWTEQAGDQATRALAFDHAAELYQRTLVLTAHPPAHEVSLRTRLGDALANGGRGAPAADAYLAGAALVDGDEALELRRRAAEQLLRSGHLDEGLAVIDTVLRDVGLPAVSRRRSSLTSLLIQRALLRIRRWRGPGRATASDEQRRRLACCWSAVVGLTMTSPLRMAEYQARHLRLALAVHEPLRIAHGLSFEATASALANPWGPEPRVILEQARTWAAKVDDKLSDAYVTMAEGTVAFLCGEWDICLARCETAERIFRDDCVGVAWEIGTASHMQLSCLWHLGRIRELRPRLSRALDEADHRGDLYTATELRTALHPTVCLMDDQEATARDVLAHAQTGLAERETTMQHWQHLQSSMLVELYAGAPVRAVELMTERLPAIRRAFLLRIYIVRVFTAFLRMTAWLGALAAGAPEPARLRASIRRTRNSLGTDVGARSVSALVGGGLAVLRGDLDAAVKEYREAVVSFEATASMLPASVARWRLGELLGGEEGRALVVQVEATMRAEGIVRPDRVVAMLAPVPPDARRIGDD